MEGGEDKGEMRIGQRIGVRRGQGIGGGEDRGWFGGDTSLKELFREKNVSLNSFSFSLSLHLHGQTIRPTNKSDLQSRSLKTLKVHIVINDPTL